MGILEDIEDALTDSVAKDGQTTMTGALKLADGSAASPGATFGSDTNTGFYRISGDTIGIACNGAEVARVTTSGITLASGKTLSLTAAAGAPDVVRTGVIQEWGGTIASIPTGYLFCDGSAVSRTTYSALFTAIGTRHGAGDGSTTFNLPDKCDVLNIGAKQDDSSIPKTNVTGALTASGGSKDAVNVSHSHTATVTDPGHDHTTTIDYNTSIAAGGAQSAYIRGTSAADDDKASSTETTGVTVAISTEGSSGTNANLPPYVAAVYMIKT
jgi:microcystin-dependent protein